MRLMSKNVAWAGAVALALVVLGGCSDDTDAGGAKPDSASGSGAPAPPGGGSDTVAAGPAYTGPALPGLTDKPLWSVDTGDGSRPQVDTATGTVAGGTVEARVVGNAVALVRSELTANLDVPSPAPGANTVGGDWNTVEFRDAASGSLRGAVNARGRLVSGTWRGKPVLYAVHTEQTASDGLSAAKRSTVWLALDENGAEAGKVVLPDDGDGGTEETVVDGWVVRTAHDGSDTTVNVRPPDGSSPGVTVTQDSSDFDGGADRQVFGGTLFSYDEPDGDDVKHLVATDIATGRRTWTTATVRRPDGTPPAAETSGHAPHIVRMVGADRVVIAWDAGSKGTFGSATQWGLYNLATGNLVYAGPRVDSGYYRTIVDREESLMLVASGTGPDVRSTAWDLKTGQIVWRQPEKGELPIESFVVVNGFLYASKRGYSPSGGMNGDNPRATDPLVVDARTKSVVLPAGVPGDLFPRMTGDGHGVVATADAIFVFGPAPRG